MFYIFWFATRRGCGARTYDCGHVVEYGLTRVVGIGLYNRRPTYLCYLREEILDAAVLQQRSSPERAGSSCGSRAPVLLTMAAVGKAAAANTSQWDTKKHIAYSHVAHLGVDNVLFALVSGVIKVVLLNNTASVLRAHT